MAGGDYTVLMAKETWIEVRVIVPARMQEEASLFLTDFSGRGVIIEEENVPAGGVVIRAYFRPEEYGDWQRQELQDYIKRLSGYELSPLGLEVRQVAEEDWAEAWKAHFKPLKVTDHLVIRPPWEEYAAQPGETVITIYPGMAFGTGRHASTLLCLRALEQVWEEHPPRRRQPLAGFGRGHRHRHPGPDRGPLWRGSAGHRPGPGGRGRGPGKRASE